MPALPYIAGGILWGDKTIQTGELGNEETPARTSIGTDPDWNGLVTWLQHATLGHAHTGLTDGGTKVEHANLVLVPSGDEHPSTYILKGSDDALLVDPWTLQDSGSSPRITVSSVSPHEKFWGEVEVETKLSVGEPIPSAVQGLNIFAKAETFTVSKSHTRLTGPGSSPFVAFGANGLTYTFLQVAGGLELGASRTGLNIIGLSFGPNIIHALGGSSTITDFTGALIKTQGVSTPSVTITNETGVHAVVGTYTFSVPTITNQRGMRIQQATGVTPTLAVGLAIDAITLGTTRKGIENASSLHMTRLDTKTGTYTMLTSDYGIKADATSGAWTLTLPTAANVGHIVFIMKSDSSANAVTVSRAGTDTIEGATTISLANQYDSLVLQSDGAGTWTRLDL